MDWAEGGLAIDWAEPPPPPAPQGEARERFNEIQQELSQLSTKFSNHVLDATKAFKRVCTGERAAQHMSHDWAGGVGVVQGAAAR